MSATEQQNAPGCFGSPSIYSIDSDICRACPGFIGCADASLATLEQIRSTIDVRDLLAKHSAIRLKAIPKLMASTPLVTSPIPVAQPPKIDTPVERTAPVAKTAYAISAHDQAVLAMLGTKNVRTRDQALTLCKAGKIDELRASLPLQRNPFAVSGPKYLRIACDLLTGGGFTKGSLKMALVTQLDWTDGTAGSHVAVACALLYSFGIASVDTSGAFVVNPELMQHTNESNNNKGTP